MNTQRYQTYLQQALDKYKDDLTIIASMLHTEGPLIPPNAIKSLRETTGTIMSYIYLQILSAGGDAILESHLKSLLSQVKEGVMKSVQGETVIPSQDMITGTPSTTNPAILHYKAVKAAIDSYRNSIFQLLKLCPASAPLPDLITCYDKL